MIKYFVDLFSTANQDWDPIIRCMSPKITREQNLVMLAEVEESEVKAVLFNMHPDKSPCPDGMIPGFYQKFWKIIGKDVVQVVNRFFATGNLDVELQSTNIVLLPKKKNPMHMGDLRPICLCHVVYKVISKVLANRVKKHTKINRLMN